MTCKDNCLCYELCSDCRDRNGEPSCDKANCNACRFFINRDDYRKVVFGEWVRERCNVRCTNCKHQIRDVYGSKAVTDYDFCPICGAIMRGEKN